METKNCFPEKTFKKITSKKLQLGLDAGFMAVLVFFYFLKVI